MLIQELAIELIHDDEKNYEDEELSIGNGFTAKPPEVVLNTIHRVRFRYGRTR
jgi:hypothetical protein